MNYSPDFCNNLTSCCHGKKQCAYDINKTILKSSRDNIAVRAHDNIRCQSKMQNVILSSLYSSPIPQTKNCHAFGAPFLDWAWYLAKIHERPRFPAEDLIPYCYS